MKSALVFIISLVIFFISLYLGSYLLTTLPVGHWALFPVYITMSLGMCGAGVVALINILPPLGE